MTRDQASARISPETAWCVVPVYNNAATLRSVVERCLRRLPRVLVIDDGSTDARAADLLAGLGAEIVRHDVNRGKGAALMTALAEVASRGGGSLITIDADGQHDPDDLPAFLAALRPDTVWIGRRDFSSAAIPGASRFGRAFSNFWFKLETGLTVADTQSGFRAYPVAPLRSLRFSTRAYDWEIEVLVRAAWAGLKIETLPIRVHYAPRGERVSHFKPWRDNVRLSLLHTRLVGRALLPIPHRKIQIEA